MKSNDVQFSNRKSRFFSKEPTVDSCCNTIYISWFIYVAYFVYLMDQITFSLWVFEMSESMIILTLFNAVCLCL